MDTIFFALSKIARFFIDPGNVLLFLLLFGTTLVWLKRTGPAKIVLCIASVLSLVLVSVPVGNTALTFLENRFPANPSLPNRIDGILVLGGSYYAHMTIDRGQISVDGSFERLLTFVRLAKRFPEAKTVYTGGSGSLLSQGYKEADFVEPILIELGMDTKNTVFENQSRNTYENAINSKMLVNPAQNEVWILVTSAAHMPRATGVFRANKWPNIIPYPVDFNKFSEYSVVPPMSLTRGLSATSNALSEFTGLAAYYLTGKTGSLIPSP